MANIYQGRDSCYARKEKTYITGSGVTQRNMATFVRFILRDLRRGWTYDQSCRKIKMTKKLAIKRLVYLLALCKKHTDDDEACERAYDRHVTPVVLRLSGKGIARKKEKKKAKKAKAKAKAKAR